MLVTRTLSLYDQSSTLLCVHRFCSFVEASCTARAASPDSWTQRNLTNSTKYFFFTSTYFGWTAWTAISGFSYMRVRVRVFITDDKIFFIYAFSRHIKLRNICPICPYVEIIDKNAFLAVLLYVQYFSIAVLAVQQLKLTYEFLLKLALTTELSGRKTCTLRQSGCETGFFASIKAGFRKPYAYLDLSPHPLVKGPYNHLRCPRAGATPIVSQSNGLKVWVNAVNGINGLLSGVNAHG